MTMLDLFLADPTDPVERAQAVADIETLRALSSRCDCDRCCTSCPHETGCPALGDGVCGECDDDGDYCSACGGAEPRECRTCGEPADAEGRIEHRPGTPCTTDYRPA